MPSAEQPLPHTEQTGQDLADIVSRLRRAMRRAARAADPANALSVAQLELLSCLAERPGLRPGELARMLRLTETGVAPRRGWQQSSEQITGTPLARLPPRSHAALQHTTGALRDLTG